ncbi:MAG: lytic transglycosylase domain-containing protein [Candidatus Kapabacteria bacterium]|nr:lytic transglycosylase domain-containing protein [Candidatus Kapabacteria bacterium]
MKHNTLRTIAATVVIAGLLACSDSTKVNSQTPQGAGTSQQVNYLTYICSLKLPSTLTFCGEKVPLDIPEVRERAEREFYVNIQSPGQLILNYKRLSRYFPLFSSILKQEGVPDDLKYISLAESALYMAKSPKDAVGLWQFMEGTAKRYGLRVDDDVDERKHVEKSTRAAIAYLKKSYAKFGSWTLAAASYNQGYEGTVDDVDFQRTTSFYDMFLNDETSRYIFRIVVLKELMEHAASYGMSINQSELYPAYQSSTVTVADAIPDLSAWALDHGTTYKEVKTLNPWIRRRALPKPKSGSWEIAVPK